MLGVERNKELVSNTHLCIDIFEMRMANSWPPYFPGSVLGSCSIPITGSQGKARAQIQWAGGIVQAVHGPVQIPSALSLGWLLG